jgi:hypothetical protein
MNCETVAKLIPLYFYGELNAEEEERVEEHLHECALCARQLERQRAVAAALDERSAELPSYLLADCRGDLMAAIRGGAPRMPQAGRSPWALFLDALGATFGSVGRVPAPVGALALIALGFFCARFTGAWNTAVPGVATAGLAPSDNVFATVRSVHPDNDGRVQIAFDETRRRVVSGRMEDQDIRRLLLAAAHEENASVRVESMDVLKSRCNSNEVRDALLDRVRTDPNDGVRLKALEGLKPLASDPEVRKTLSQVLRSDSNPAMRYQVVELLVQHPDDSVVGVLQGLVGREANSSVRMKLEKALKEMNASVGTF